MTNKNTKVTSNPVAAKASQTLSSGSGGGASMTATGNPLTHARPPKKQTKHAASTAESITFTNGRESDESKFAAASILIQTHVKFTVNN